MTASHHFTLETDRLWLINCDKAILEKLFEGDAQLANLLGIQIPEKWTEHGEPAFRWTWDALGKHPGTEQWWTYLPILKAENMLVGSGGYTGFPTEEGVVEIGYEIAESYRGKGLATEVVQALVLHAFTDKQVLKVQAHTLPVENASNHILKKFGFEYAGESVDPNEGAVWKWHLTKK
jgi:[ribosomal protein S5]-alanine N-acetyltransferase